MDAVTVTCRNRDALIRELEDLEGARAAALHPPFYRRPDLEAVDRYDDEIDRLHAEVDSLEDLREEGIE